MSDAVLVGDSTPIESENPFGRSASPIPISELIADELEDDCMSPAEVPDAASENIISPIPLVVVKPDPMNGPSSPDSSCPSSPSPPPPKYIKASIIYPGANSANKSIVRQPAPNKFPSSTLGIIRKNQMISLSGNIIKMDPSSTPGTRSTLPPTPPSCTSSDNEGNVSPLRTSYSPSSILLNSASTSSRLPTPAQLISSSPQPKGSAGVLVLTEYEKRALAAEGCPIPSRLPLTKAEERCLRKVQRKIKNKMSAQESRKKKKEYEALLERKVEILSSENSDFRKQISSLEDANAILTCQVNRLQTIITGLGGVNT